MSKTSTAALAALTFTTAALTIPSVAFAKGKHHDHHRHGYWNGRIWVVVANDDEDEMPVGLEPQVRLGPRLRETNRMPSEGPCSGHPPGPGGLGQCPMILHMFLAEVR